MATTPNRVATDLFWEWKSEESEMKASIDDLCIWMNEVNQLGIPHFGEAGSRLQNLRHRMLQHFERENLIVENLVAQVNDLGDPSASSAVADLQKQASSDHEHLLSHLDDLIGRLHHLEPPFSSWSEAMDEIGGFTVELQEHEDYEWEQLSAIVTAKDSLG